MLILARKLGESIRIGDDITVMVTEIGENQIKLGITAPKSVMILRQELADEDDARTRPEGADQ